jgi:hypothetical protein
MNPPGKNAAIVAAEPAVLPLDTDQQIRGELVIGAGLQAAEQSAIMVVAGDKTVENFVAAEGAADVTADVEAGPVVDWHRGIGRSLAVGASPEIGRKCRHGRAESDEGHTTEQEFLHWPSLPGFGAAEMSAPSVARS